MINHEFPEPEGDFLGEMWSGPHWSPTKPTELLVEQSDDARSFNSQSISGILLETQAYGRDAYALRVDDSDAPFLLPDHTALNTKLKEAKAEERVWIRYTGTRRSTQTNNDYHVYDVKRVKG